MKKVWTLYRVSTKGQVNPDEDIPLQKTSCMNFIKSNPTWELKNELYERGVSGWKLKTDERDELIEIKRAAENKEFDVLLVFMFDRLGRREDETPLVVQYLIDHGIEVWSVKEGQAKIEEHVDKLVNYIRFWQSSGESKKTSIRVKEIIEQMNEKAQYTGTTPPYGYEVYDTGVKHWKYDKTIKDMRINQEERELVKIIFDLYISKGYGVSRIAKYLNSSGYKTRKGRYFRVNTIFNILKNPICIGIKRYNVRDKNDHDKVLPKEFWKYSDRREDWVIIEEETYYKVQDIMKARKDKQKKLPNKGKLLLNGIAICGYCGNKLYSDVTRNKYKLKDGTEKERLIRRYRCLDARTSETPHEKSLYASDKHEKVFDKHFLLQINNLLSDKSKLINKRKMESQFEIEKFNNEIQSLRKSSEKLDKDLSILNNEITKSLLGESAFSPDKLSQLIKEKEEEKKNLEEVIREKEENLTRKKNLLNNEDEFILTAQKIKTSYENSDIDSKKMMIATVVDDVIFKKDEIEIRLKTKL